MGKVGFHLPSATNHIFTKSIRKEGKHREERKKRSDHDAHVKIRRTLGLLYSILSLHIFDKNDIT